MKIVGMVLIAIGLALFVFVAASFFKEQGKVLSPIPEEKGVKVIFVSPSP